MFVDVKAVAVGYLELKDGLQLQSVHSPGEIANLYPRLLCMLVSLATIVQHYSCVPFKN